MAMDEGSREILKQIQFLVAAAEKQDKCSDAIEKTLDSINSWRPRLEARVDDLHQAVSALQQHAAHKGSNGASDASIPGDPAVAHRADAPAVVGASLLGKPPLGTDLGQGHGELPLHRGLMTANLGVPASTPVTGTNNFQTPLHLRSTTAEHDSSAQHLFAHMGQSNPTLQFPVFDGENPQMWQTLAEQYFAIHESYWVSMASLNFSGSPKVWLHSVRKKLAGFTWESFCALLCTRFGRDRHQLLIRQFYTIKQTHSVADYVERFEIVMNSLLAYSDQIHPLYFLTRFIEGLRSDIRAVVMVQRPTDLDTACALALLQEEVAECETIQPLW